MERDVSDIKRLLDKITNYMERLVTQTDQLEEDLRCMKIALDKINDREESRDRQAANPKKW